VHAAAAGVWGSGFSFLLGSRFPVSSLFVFLFSFLGQRVCG
jgi:hypothetical protein